MKLAPLPLVFVCAAAPARADVAVPRAKSWRDSCAARMDAAAVALGLKPGARASVIDLRREDGTANPVQYVDYAFGVLEMTVGDEPEARPDKPWTKQALRSHQYSDFRRYHNRFAKIISGYRDPVQLKAALDQCLTMGESK